MGHRTWIGIVKIFQFILKKKVNNKSTFGKVKRMVLCYVCAPVNILLGNRTGRRVLN